MKTATVLLVGVAAVAVTFAAVTLLKPAPVTATPPVPGSDPVAGWVGALSGLLNSTTGLVKTFGANSSPKPTTPGQLATAPEFQALPGVPTQRYT